MLSAVIFLIGCSHRQAFFTGEVDATDVDVSVKIPGRVSKILVHEGEWAKKGQMLGYLENREMEAKLRTATAALEDANQQFELASKTFERIQNLYSMGVVPKQQLDETQYKYNAAKQKIEASKGQLNEVQVYNDEMLIKAPIDAEITGIISHPGEMVAPGYPVITLTDLNDQWVVFNIREDSLKKITKGMEVSVKLPAIDDNMHPFNITYISSLGAFAKWKATNELGSFDLKSFEIRARAKDKIENMRPGMTALVFIK
jgi:HlyD family secretion protein